MDIKIVLLIFTLNLIHVESSKKVIDNNLQSFRKEYREFRSSTRLQLDQSYFEIYNSIALKVKEFEKLYDEPLKEWHRTCSEYSLSHVETSVVKRFNLVCDNVLNLLKRSATVHHEVLSTFFPGKLLKPSPPMETFDELCSEIESNMEDVWNLYIRNKTCVKKKLKDIIPLFKPYVREILGLTDKSIERIKPNFEHCKINIKKAISYVEFFIKELKECSSNVCLKKLLLQETDCSDKNCGRLYASIRSGIFSIVETTKIFRKNYEFYVGDLAEVDELAEKKIDGWVSDVKKACNMN